LYKQRSRFTHYYFYLRDEVLGPMVLRVASFFPFHTTYYITMVIPLMEKELLRRGITFAEPLRTVDDTFASGSLDAVILFGSALLIGIWGGDFLTAVARELRHRQPRHSRVR